MNERTDFESLDSELLRLKRSASATPPPELDALVKRQLLHAAAEQRAALARHEHTTALAEPMARPVGLPLGERCVYALGLTIYGAQAALLIARTLWRALAS